MMDALRDRMAAILAAHQRCVISACGDTGVVSLAVAYRALGLELECALPRWSEPAYCLEEDPRVAIVVIPDGPDDRGWLHLHGVAELIGAPDWRALAPTLQDTVDPADLYVAARVRPRRLDLLDDRWGARTTLELA